MTVFFLIPGVVCLFLGGVFLLLYRRSSIQTEASEHSLTGKVWAKLADTGSRTEYDYDNRSRTVYFGIYEYDTADGQHLSAASDFGYIDPKDVPGARGNMVKARYNPNNPAVFVLEEEQAVSKTVWPKFKKTGMILTALGIFFAATAVATMLGIFRIPAFAAGAYGQDAGDLAEDVAFHCTEAARNVLSTEDLANLVGMTKYSMLHEGVTLDDVIYSISEGRFYDTADFEDTFITADYDSAAFCSSYLNYMKKLSLENGRKYAPNGSLLLPFEADCATQIDCTKTGQSELYRIADSHDYVESTADLSDVTDAGRSLSYWEYWSDAMTGTYPTYDYDGTYGYPW